MNPVFRKALDGTPRLTETRGTGHGWTAERKMAQAAEHVRASAYDAQGVGAERRARSAPRRKF